MSDKQKPRTLSLEEVSERTGIPLNKLQEQQAARQAQASSQIRIDSAGAGSAQPAVASRVDENPSWYNRLKGMASDAYNSAANFASDSVKLGKELGTALENSGTENSHYNQFTQRRLDDAMKP